MTLWRDLVHAARSLAKARAFTFVCVISLGIGMAPVIAIPYGARIFTTPPPGVNTEGLVELVTTPAGPRGESDQWSYPDFVDLRDADTGMTLVGFAQAQATVLLPDSREAAVVSPMFVSRGYFEAIGVALTQGPGFPDTTDPVVVVGHDFWQDRLGAEPGIVGQALVVDGTAHTVVGIGPAEFNGHLLRYDGGEL